MSTVSVNNRPTIAASTAEREAANGRRPSAASPRPRLARSAVRVLGESAIVALVLLALVRTWLIDFRAVDGSSMAETLLGPHVDIKCPDCGWNFAAGVEGAESVGRPAVCSNCGSTGASIDTATSRTGDGVLIARAGFLFRQPRRWEVVAFRAPNDLGQVCVKRVAGLPGERIEILDGDVYADGQIIRKSLAEQRALAITVHHDGFRPAAADAEMCWQAAAGSQWQMIPAGFLFRPSHGREGAPRRHGDAEEGVGNGEKTERGAGESLQSGEPDSSFLIPHSSFQPDWLTYHHVRRNGSSGRVEEAAVVDVYGYNQTFPVRDVHPVRDLSLCLQLTAAGEGTLYLRGGDGVQDFVCRVSADGHADLFQNGKHVEESDKTTSLCGAPRLVEFSLVDRQCLLAVDGRVLFAHPFDRRPTDAPTTTRPFAMASDGLSLRVEGVHVCRDVYYGPPSGPSAGSPSGRPWRMGMDEFFVLADNSPRGLDSRHQEFSPAVAAKLFVGKPFLAYGAGYGPAAGWSSIQVPALRQIRYIR